MFILILYKKWHHNIGIRGGNKFGLKVVSISGYYLLLLLPHQQIVLKMKIIY